MPKTHTLASDQILKALKSSARLLLHCHPGPDPDSVGSVLAMSLYLDQLGKNYTIISGDSPPSPTLTHLPNYAKIQPQNFFQTDLSKYDLFIVFDSSSLGMISKLGEVNFPSHLQVVVIDHHPGNSVPAQLKLIDTHCVATCELLYRLFKLWKVNITPSMATCLILGIHSDTFGFRTPNSTADSLAAASHLARIAPDYPSTIFLMENSNSPHRLKFISLGLSNIETFFSNTVAISTITYKELVDHQISKPNTENADVAEMLISVPAWEIGIRLTEKEPNAVYFSFRTRDPSKYNVGELARHMGGGGHPAAAGALVHQPLQLAKSLLLSTLRSTFPNLGDP